MENPKTLQTSVDLEQARCSERWVDIPELAKRYKKYHPYQSGIDMYILLHIFIDFIYLYQYSS